MISVIIPLYNKEQHIARTIRSVLSQTYQDFEIIIVNDGSTDNSVHEVTKISDSRIRLIHQPNGGVAAARNRGTEEAHAELIAFLDADDEWCPRYLEKQYELYCKFPECGMYATSYINKIGNKPGEPIVLKKMPFSGQGILSNYFEVASCSHPPICSISVMTKKSLLDSIGGFPTGIRSGEDLLTWAKLAISAPIAYDTAPLAIYNMGEGYNLNNLPPRQPDASDPVGRELKNILKSYTGPDRKYLKYYISLWHKMRASTSIRYNAKRSALKECLKSLYYNPFNLKSYFFLIYIPIPSKIKQLIIRKFYV